MSDLLQAAVTLGAVVVGGLVSFLGGWLSERHRYQRERASRWDSRRLDAYVEYATALKNETRIMMRIAAGMGLGPQTDPIDLVEGRTQYELAEHERSRLFEAILLLGDEDTINTARTWQTSCWECYRYVVDSTDPASDVFIEKYHETGSARESFYITARLSLDILPIGATAGSVSSSGSMGF